MKILSPCSPTEFWARSPGGNVRISLEDYVGRAVFFFGDLDPKITWVLKQVLKPGDRALDVGANIGLLTLWMSKLVGPQGAVHAFEPNPILCRILGTTLARNKISNVKLHSFALGASEGEMELRVPKGNLGAGSLVRQTSQAEQICNVPVRKLDDVIFQQSNSGIALIKLDVEGFELEVLRGARRVLQELRPAAILFESHEKPRRHETTPVMSLLHECDYEFLVIPRCLIWMRTKAVDLAHPDAIRGHDFIAVRRGDAFTRMRRQLRAE
jgi:FkbM family methyltransferase